MIQHVSASTQSQALSALLFPYEQRAGFPLTLELSGFGLPNRSWVKISQVRTLSVERLTRKLGRATPEVVEQVVAGLNEIVGA